MINPPGHNSLWRFGWPASVESTQATERAADEMVTRWSLQILLLKLGTHQMWREEAVNLAFDHMQNSTATRQPRLTPSVVNIARSICCRNHWARCCGDRCWGFAGPYLVDPLTIDKACSMLVNWHLSKKKRISDWCFTQKVWMYQNWTQLAARFRSLYRTLGKAGTLGATCRLKDDAGWMESTVSGRLWVVTGSDGAIFFIVLDFLDDIASKPFPVLALPQKMRSHWIKEKSQWSLQIDYLVISMRNWGWWVFFHDWIAEMPWPKTEQQWWRMRVPVPRVPLLIWAAALTGLRNLPLNADLSGCVWKWPLYAKRMMMMMDDQLVKSACPSFRPTPVMFTDPKSLEMV